MTRRREQRPCHPGLTIHVIIFELTQTMSDDLVMRMWVGVRLVIPATTGWDYLGDGYIMGPHCNLRSIRGGVDCPTCPFGTYELQLGQKGKETNNTIPLRLDHHVESDYKDMQVMELTQNAQRSCFPGGTR